MKGAVVLLALVSLAFSAPQPRKVFHENVEDFLMIIEKEAGHDLQHLMEHYLEFEEFWVSLDYLMTNDFKTLVYEMESLPEFKAVIDFLEQDNIDVTYFLDRFNGFLEEVSQNLKKARHQLSGRDFTSLIRDCISEFPKQKLAALFDEKMTEDEEFRVAMENLRSEEWAQIFNALWENEVFQAEVKTLAEHGIEIEVLLDEVLAIFGQN